MQEKTEKDEKRLYNVTKVNKFKDVLMVRMSNKSIQLIFEDIRDGFIFETKTHRLFYFDESLLTKN